MNVLYVCRVSGYQANGNQIDIPKNIGIDFLMYPRQILIKVEIPRLMCAISRI